MQPHGPIWPRSSASANSVKVGLPGIAESLADPPPLTSDFEQQAAAAIAPMASVPRNMQASIARLTAPIDMARPTG